MEAYLQRNIEGLPLNQRCLGKVVSIAYCEYERLALVIQHRQGMPRIILSSVALFGSTIFFPTILVVWWSELLTTNHEVPASIPGSTMGIFLVRGGSPW